MPKSTEEQGTTLSMAKFFWGHLTASFDAPMFNLTGRTALVTGGNAGLGYETVLHLARNNITKIIIASRNRQKCEQAVENVHRAVPYFRGTISIHTLDLASFDSVKSFCAKVIKEEERLDIVIANAGMLSPKFKKTVDGHEQVIQVNVLSTGLLGMLLLPKLAQTADLPIPTGGEVFVPRLVIVASEVHYWTKTPFTDPQNSVLDHLADQAKFTGGEERYNISKLFDIFIAREMAKLPIVQSGKVTVCSVNPGLNKSGFRDDLGVVLATIVNWISWKPEFGSRAILYAATKNFTPGAYISYCREEPPSKYIFSQEGRAVQKQFWEESMDLWAKLEPGVREVGH